jgi:hypothetical protein
MQKTLRRVAAQQPDIAGVEAPAGTARVGVGRRFWRIMAGKRSRRLLGVAILYRYEVSA